MSISKDNENDSTPQAAVDLEVALKQMKDDSPKISSIGKIVL